LINLEVIGYLKQLLDYRPIGRRRTGRPLKRLLTDTTVRSEQVIYWPKFLSKRRRMINFYQ